MNSSNYRGIWAVFAITICPFCDTFAQIEDSAPVRISREEQERAIALTRKLLEEHLDVQLRQLEENGLTDRDVYLEIAAMRRHLRQLADSEMRSIVDRLAEFNGSPNLGDSGSLATVRKQISDVVRQLSIERQVVLRRLKIVELAAQLKELIRLQTAARDAADDVPLAQQTQQESLVLKAIEDQRHAKELYLIVVDTMDDVRTWNGPWSAVASDGLRILKVAKVGQQFDEANRDLQSLQFAKAIEKQTSVIQVLNKLLAIVARASGAIESKDLAHAERVRKLIESQTQVRDATRLLNDLEAATTELIEGQSEIHRGIVEFQELLPDSTIARNHAQKAETAAFEAAAKLLDNDRLAALTEQGHVLGNLLAIERTLADLAQQSQFKSAAQMTQLVSKLMELESKVHDAQSAHDEFSSREGVKKIADQIRQLGSVDELPSPIPNELSDLADAINTEVNLTGQEKADGVDESAKKVTQSFERLRAIIATALQDARRRESAIIIGELARATEVLERLSAEEKSIAESLQSEALAPADSDAADNGKHVANRQAEVIAIARKLIEATDHTAPDASQALIQSVQTLNRASDALNTITSHDQVLQSPRTAITAADEFGMAAKLIRQQISNTALQFNQQMTSRAEELSKAEHDVMSVVDKLPTNQRLTQLVGVRSTLSKVFEQQAIASGKPDAALAIQMRNSLLRVIALQDEMDSMISGPDVGAAFDLNLISKHAELSERLQSLIETTDKILPNRHTTNQARWTQFSQSLNEAHRASTEAVRQSLDGDHQILAVSQNTIRTSLKNVLDGLTELISFELRQPSTDSIDLKMQSEVVTQLRSLGTSKQMSQPFLKSIEAVVTRLETEQSSSTDATQASDDQVDALTALQAMDQQLAAEIQAEVNQRTGDFAKRVPTFESLANQTSQVDATAAQSVKFAESLAGLTPKGSQSVHGLDRSSKQIEMALIRAATDLGVAERLRRQDAELADTVAQQITQQQSAAETIAQRASSLEQTESPGNIDESSSTARRRTAKELEDAQERFVEALRITGQVAVELSRQREVANVPLREALAMASNLQSNALLVDSFSDETTLDQNSGSTENDPSGQAQPDAPNDSSATEQTASGSPGQRDDRSGGKGSQNSRSAKANEMGTGFVSQSPDLTAEMMAGSKARREAKKSLEQQLPMGQQSGDDANQYSNASEDGDDGQSMTSENAGESKLSKNEGAATRNQRVKGGQVDRQREGTEAPGMATGKSREKEERISSRRFHDEAWFAKLPPDVQRSIRAGTATKPPRAYEERLKKYFQSTD